MVLCCATVYAQTDTKLQVVVTGVEGNVRVRANSDTEKWVPAVVGMKLDVGAEFRTGLRSAVRFSIPPAQTITLDRLGTIKVLTAIQQANGKLKTNLGMKYGRTRYKIETAGIEHSTIIKTPTIALTVRGTEVGVQQDFVGLAWCNSHYAFFDGEEQPQVLFGEGTEVSEKHHRPAEHRLHKDLRNPYVRHAKSLKEGVSPIDHPEGTFRLENQGIKNFRKLHALNQGQMTGQFTVTFDLTWQPIDGLLPGDNLNLFVLLNDNNPTTNDLVISQGLIPTAGLTPPVFNALSPVPATPFGGLEVVGNGNNINSSNEVIRLINPPMFDAIFGVQMVGQGSGAAHNNTGIVLKVRERLDGVLIATPPAINVPDLTFVSDVGPIDNTGSLPLYRIDPP
jgi:hypothetical protein